MTGCSITNEAFIDILQNNITIRHLYIRDANKITSLNTR